MKSQLLLCVVATLLQCSQVHDLHLSLHRFWVLHPPLKAECVNKRRSEVGDWLRNRPWPKNKNKKGGEKRSFQEVAENTGVTTEGRKGSKTSLEEAASFEISSSSWRAAGTRRGGKEGGGGWRQPSSAGLGVSVSRLSRAWWQSRAAGQGVAAGPWPGHSEEPNTSDYTSNLSKCRYVWQLSLPLQLFQLRWWRIPFFQHGRREENVQTGVQVWRVINKSFSFPPFFVY